MFFRSKSKNSTTARRSQKTLSRRRSLFESLESRQMLALYNWSNVANTLSISLGEGEDLFVTQSGATSSFEIDGGGTFAHLTGNTAPGNGTNTITINTNDLAASLNISNSGSVGQNNVFFSGSGSLTSATVNINLTNSATTGSVSMFGGFDLTVSDSLSITTNQRISVGFGSIITATGSGSITLLANQQPVSSNGDFIGIDLDGATITTNGTGNILLQGRGGNATGGNIGVRLRNGARVQSTALGAGAGEIVIDGTGGAGIGNNNRGVDISQSTVTSIDGDIQITGRGGTGSGATGVYLISAEVSSVGVGANAANITIDGTGGTGTGDRTGIYFLGTQTTIISADGDIHLTGAAPVGAAIIVSSSSIQSTGTADVTLVADSLNIQGIINAGANTVTLRQKTNGTNIKIGPSADTTANTLELSDTELDRITAGTIHIGDVNSGTITVSAAIQHAGDANFEVTTGRNIVFNSGSSWTTTNGSLTFIANQQTIPTSGNFVGIEVNNATITTNGSGDILLQGRGGDVGSEKYGVFLYHGTTIQSTAASANAGTITINGTGGSGVTSSESIGVYSFGAIITSKHGHIEIIGTGGTGAGNHNRGVVLGTEAHISSTGTGTNAAEIVITGTGGTGLGSFNSGVAFGFFGDGRISSIDGDIEINGTAEESSDSHGISLFSTEAIKVTGTANVTLIADSMDIGASPNTIAAGPNTVTLKTKTTDGSIGINIGGSDSATALGLTDAELDHITAGTIQIGDENTGTITVSAAIQHSGDADFFVTAPQKIVFNPGSAWATTDGNLEFRTVIVAADTYTAIDVNGATITTNGSGKVLLAGRVWAAIGNNIGVHIRNGSQITSSASGSDAGEISIHSDVFGADNNDGTLISGANTLVTSVDGRISISGQVVDATGAANRGFALVDGAVISSTGTGSNAADISIQGNAGMAAWAENGTNGVAVFIANQGTAITTVRGRINISGSSSKGKLDDNRGIQLSDSAKISSIGTGFSVGGIDLSGHVTNTGISSVGNAGILVDTDASITSMNGHIQLAANTNSPSNLGINIDSANAIELFSTTGTKVVGLESDSIHIGGAGTTINAGVNRVRITQRTNGAGIDIGSEVDSVGAIALSDAELDHISARTIQLGNSNTGTISVTAAIQHSDDAHFEVITERNIVFNSGSSWNTTNGDLTFSANQQAVPASGNFVGIDVNGATITTNGTGDLLLQGRGGDSGSQNYAVYLRSTTGTKIESTATGANAGTITIDGTGGTGTGSNFGVYIELASITSIDGDISINGTGGNGTGHGNYGVVIYSAKISSTGIGNNAAKISIDGFGGTGIESNSGVGIFGIVITSIDGDISITGQGGNASGFANIGVSLGSPQISSTGTGANAAKITIDGSGGTGIDQNYGVNFFTLDFAVTTMTSVDGDISITGKGGSGSGDSNIGVIIEHQTQISSTGLGPSAAKITIDGTGGNGADRNSGVVISDVASVTSIDGDISISGQGGTGNEFNHGVSLSAQSVISTGTGPNAAKIVIDGIAGGTTLSTFNYGVIINGSSDARPGVQSTDGDVQIVGALGLELGFGVLLGSPSAISSVGTADVTLIADTMSLLSSVNISVGDNTVTLKTKTTDGLIGINIGAYDTSSALGLDDFELDSISAGKIIIGDANIPNSVTIGGSIQHSSDADFEVVTGRNIVLSNSSSWTTINGDLTFIANQHTTPMNGNFTGIESNGGAIITNGTGDILLRGRGGDIDYHNFGIELLGGAQIKSTSNGSDAGGIVLKGTGGHGVNSNIGIAVIGASITTVDGSIELVGYGGVGDFNNLGIEVSGNSVVKSTGSGIDTATISVTGYGGTGTSINYGVIVALSEISSEVTGIEIRGKGGAGSVSQSFGVILDGAAVVSSTGTGTNAATILIEGTGGGLAGSGNLNGGVAIQYPGTKVTSIVGDIEIIGTAGAGNSTAIHIYEAQVITTGTANVILVGNSISILGPNTISVGLNTVTLRQETNNTDINLGGPDVIGVLGLTDAELDVISAGTIKIGDANTGNITISQAISRTIATNFVLTGDTVTADALGTDLDLQGGTLSFAAGTILYFGLQNESNYDQLIVNGIVDLTGVVLDQDLNFSPLEGTSLKIIDATILVGIFTNYAQGDVVVDPLKIDYDTANGDVLLVAPILIPHDVTVVYASGNLTITGSDISNHFLITEGTSYRQVIVRGLFNVDRGQYSLINGLPDAIFNNVTGTITVNLGAGNDELEVRRIIHNSDLTINAGEGDDTITLGKKFSVSVSDTSVYTRITGTLTISGEAGEDTILLGRVYGDGTQRIDGGADNDSIETFVVYAGAVNYGGGSGNDNIQLGYLNTKQTWIVHGYAGDDTINVYNSKASLSAYFFGEDGNDTISLDANTFSGILNVYSGIGNDTVLAGRNTMTRDAKFELDAGDDTIHFGRRFARNGAGELFIVNAGNTAKKVSIGTGSGNDTVISVNNALEQYFADLGADNDSLQSTNDSVSLRIEWDGGSQIDKRRIVGGTSVQSTRIIRNFESTF